MCDSECMCPKCLMADLNAHLVKMNVAPSVLASVNSIPAESHSVRTRYAKPGQRTGNGIVRQISEKQLRFMLFLFKTRNTSKLVRLPGSENIESMSLAGARDLIDRLLSCPELPKAEIAPELASEKQLNFISSLIDTKDVPANSREWFDGHKNEITKQSAKEMIERLLKTADKQMPKSELSDGRYAIENENGDLRFYVVRTSKSSGRQYVCVMHSDNEEYLRNGKAILAKIAENAYEAMVRYGKEIGKCGHCNRTLTDEESRKNGIGPICAEKF